MTMLKIRLKAGSHSKELEVSKDTGGVVYIGKLLLVATKVQ